MRQSLIDSHRRLLSKWRSKMFLIGPGSMEPHLPMHGAVQNLPVEEWADLGSGAGFQG